MSETTTVNLRITEVQVCVLPEDYADHHQFIITVEWCGNDRWAVKRRSECLSVDGTEWDYESIPSERQDEWLAKYRFTDYQAALDAAVKVAPTVTCMGRTAEQWMAWATPEGQIRGAA